MEDSSSLNDDLDDLFYSAFNTARVDYELDTRRMSRAKATQIAKARFEVFKSIHQEVREHIVNGLKDDGILLGKQPIRTERSEADPYVSKSRIAELRQLPSSDFDLRRREILPTAIQVDFKNELDVLLGEIVRRLG